MNVGKILKIIEEHIPTNSDWVTAINGYLFHHGINWL